MAQPIRNALGRPPLFLALSAPGLVFRRLTGQWRTLPQVLILGAPKAGTTSLAVYLAKHPAYVSAQNRELMFLQDLPNFNNKYDQSRLLRRMWGRFEDGVEAYRKFFPLERTMRRVSRRSGAPAITGDHTPFYLYCPVAQRRIRELSPQARFLIVLREPVARAFSDYRMHHGLGLDDRATFEQVVDDELRGASPDFNRSYLHQSVYEPHVQRWIKEFGRDRFLVLESGALLADPRAELRKVFAFLDLPPFEPRHLPIMNQGRYKTPLAPRTAEQLREYFEPHNARLYSLLGTDFRWS